MSDENQTQSVEVTEEWRPCASLGNVRRADDGQLISVHVIGWTGRRYIRCYRGPSLNHRRGGRYRTIRLTGLIAEAFLGPRPEGMQIDHINGIKTDDRVSNLQYVTQSENVLRAYHVQKLRSGEIDRSNGYMTQAEYDRVFELSKQGLSQVKIGKRMGRSNSTISKILSGKIRPRPAARARVGRPRVQEVYRDLRLARVELVRNLRALNPGITCREIAATLGVTKFTVFSYLREIKRGK